MNDNRSPKPVFETDEYFNYFLAVLPINETFKQKVIEQAKKTDINLTPRMIKILQFCITPRKRKDIFEHIGLKSHYDNYIRYIEPLVSNNLLILSEPESPNSPTQQYITSGDWSLHDVGKSD
jgi:ATP-dependent DNA helicase RecG